MRDIIEDFIKQKKFAVAGASRDKKKFGYTLLENLQKKGYTVFPVNPNADSIGGTACYPDLKSLPEKVDGVIAVVPPDVSINIAVQCKEQGITRLWLQQGAESDKAIDFCNKNGIKVVYKQCIMMWAPPVESFHAFHRWIFKIFGKLPK